MRSILTLLLLALVPPAFASDGVVEINQTCAASTGCFAGDAAGLPVSIVQSGSYILTSNLDGVAGQNGITISFDDVTLDLKGFAVVGVSGSLDGVGVDGTPENVTVTNGTLRGWGESGVDLLGTSNCTVENVAVLGSASGIRIDTSSKVTGCLVENNSGSGIVVFNDNNQVVDCSIVGNGSSGIFLGSSGDGANGNIIAENMVSSNQAEGIRINIGSDNRIDGNYVTNNDQGIRSSAGLTGNLFIRNMASGNASGDYGLSGDGAGPVGPASTSTSPWANIQF